MPKLTLKFESRELQDCSLGALPVSIGRLPDNDVVIDNPAVSGRHARVSREGSHYVLEDLKSTNGTFVNDKPIARHTLLEGDIIFVGKHTLVFSLHGGDGWQKTKEQFVPELGGTMMLETVKQKNLLAGVEQAQPAQAAEGVVVPMTAIPTAHGRIGTIKVIAGNTGQNVYLLAAVTTMIGKAENAQIRLRGWFKPKVAAAIARRGDGFTITPMGSKVIVNGERISGRRELAGGDLIEVGGLTLEFTLSS